MTAMACRDCVSVLASAVSRSGYAINTRGTPRTAAAATIPGSWPLAAGVAIADKVRLAGAIGAKAAASADSTSSALTPERQPIPATIRASPRSTG